MQESKGHGGVMASSVAGRSGKRAVAAAPRAPSAPGRTSGPGRRRPPRCRGGSRPRPRPRRPPRQRHPRRVDGSAGGRPARRGRTGRGCSTSVGAAAATPRGRRPRGTRPCRRRTARTDSTAWARPKVSGAAAPATLVPTSRPVPTKVSVDEPAPGSGSSCRSATRSSLPRRQRRLRGGWPARRRRTPRRLGLGPAGPIRARAPRIVEQAAQGVGHRGRVVGRRTTSPVSPSTTASAAPPLSPATWGTPAAAASRNTIPKPSCSRPRPPVAAQHREDVAAPVEAGRSSCGDAAEEPHRSAGARGSAARDGRWSRPPPPMATVRSGRLGASRAAASDEHVHALAGHEPAHRHHETPVDGKAEAGAGRRAAPGRVERHEPLGVDAGRDQHARQRRGRPPAPPSASG